MQLSPGSILLWGFVGTLVLTLIQAAGQGLRLTRMSLPFLLGTVVTGDIDRAMPYGFAVHFVNGWLFSLVYALVFEAWGVATWWLGLVLGLLHGLFALAVLIPLLPSVHPRMARRADAFREGALLEPPGFMALHYGPQTPVVTVLAHLVYGAVLGAFYAVSPG